MHDLIVVILKTLFFYFFIVLSYRIMGKREIGQLGIIDLIVSILIAELVAISIENINDSLLLTVVPIALLVVLELVLAFIAVKSRKFRTIFGGKPSLIICNGKINYSEITKQRYNMDDLLMSLRQKEVKSLEEVEYAFLEPNGKLSIFKYNPFRIRSAYPMPLVLDGQIQTSTLRNIKKSKMWLLSKLSSKGLDVKDVFYAFYKCKKIYIVRKSSIK